MPNLWAVDEPEPIDDLSPACSQPRASLGRRTSLPARPSAFRSRSKTKNSSPSGISRMRTVNDSISPPKKSEGALNRRSFRKRSEKPSPGQLPTSGQLVSFTSLASVWRRTLRKRKQPFGKASNTTHPLGFLPSQTTTIIWGPRFGTSVKSKPVILTKLRPSLMNS